MANQHDRAHKAMAAEHRQVDGVALWRVWFDGSALPNPGKMGVGALLISPTGVRYELAQIERGTGCNNEAEMLALCAVLTRAKALGAQHMLVFGDSDVAIAHASGRATSPFSRLATTIARMQSLVADFAQIELRWIPHRRNAEADRLSRLAVGLSESAAHRHSAAPAQD